MKEVRGDVVGSGLVTRRTDTSPSRGLTSRGPVVTCRQFGVHASMATIEAAVQRDGRAALPEELTEVVSARAVALPRRLTVRPLFLRWVALQSVVVTLLGAAAL